jgi:putative transposase
MTCGVLRSPSASRRRSHIVVKTQTVLPSAEILFWALLASGQITMHKVDGWQTLAEKPTIQCIDLAA